MTERRRGPGVAAVTRRGSDLDRRCKEAGIPARMLSVQDGPSWPDLRPPALLDTFDLSDDDLLALLARTPPAPIVALVNPTRRLALALLALSPTVRLVAHEDVISLARWIPYIELALSSSRATPVWLIPAPTVPKRLDPLLLPVLAALHHYPSYNLVAAACGISESTLYRMLRAVRVAFNIPPGEATRFSPQELARLILERLRDLPLPESSVASSASE